MATKILIINNKGGVGKTLIELWMAHALALLNYKVLSLTSDNQNNSFHYAGVEPKFNKGLESWIEAGTGDIIPLRKNLDYIPLRKDYIPLKNFKIKKSFEEKFDNFMKVMNDKYDFIMIDASPVLGLNEFFLKADYYVIPTFLDEATTDSIVNLLNVIDKHKVLAVIPNRVGTSVFEKDMFKKIKAILDAENIQLTQPIQQSATLLKLSSKGKTIWESNHKKAIEVQEIFEKIISELI